nr:uncharacterized protein LOC129267255 [Lytechinus pictus]
MSGAEATPGLDSVVSDKEYLKLSKRIGPDYFIELGVNLGLPIEELQQIKHSTPSISNAFVKVFLRWKNKQQSGTNIRALLGEILEETELGSLSGDLKAGNLLLSKQEFCADVPGTEPLSQDLIKMCRDDFQSNYRTDLCKIRSDPLDPDSVQQIKDIYINLDLEEEKNQKNTPLEYKNLFKIEINEEFPTRIMLQGEAGAGKTTLCAKIAWDWINGSPDVPYYVWVLVVPFREAKQNKIGRFVKSYLSKDNPTTANQITEYIRSNPKNVLIACDGLDESDIEFAQKRKVVSESISAQGASACQSQERSGSPMSKKGKFIQHGVVQPESNHHVQATSEMRENASPVLPSVKAIALADIIRSDELRRCPVLVTSRPWKANKIRENGVLRKRYTFIRVQGFSWENAEAYVRKYFTDSVATADQLIYAIKVNGIVYEHMAPYPIYISMICLMWKELDYKQNDRFRSLRTFSEIFDCIFTFLEGHYVQKETTDLDEASVETALSDISEYMKPVAKVAFIGLQENKFIFSEGDFERYSESVEVACKVGVLSREKNMTPLMPIHGNRSRYLQSKIFFPHKLFQEYMAGKHLASMYDSDGDEFNKLIDGVVLPRKEEFRNLLYFTVSRNETVANRVIERMVLCFKQYFSDETGMTNRREKDFLVDVSLESRDPKTAKMVRRMELNNEVHIGLETAAHTVAGFEFIGIIPNAATLFVSRECGDSVGLSSDVAEMICTAPSLNYVELEVVSFHDNFYAVLAEKGWKSSVRRLWIGTVKSITPDSSCQLVRALCSMENLTILTLDGGVKEEKFYSRLNTSASNLQVRMQRHQHYR